MDKCEMRDNVRGDQGRLPDCLSRSLVPDVKRDKENRLDAVHRLSEFAQLPQNVNGQ
jgi:hypothetical protein